MAGLSRPGGGEWSGEPRSKLGDVTFPTSPRGTRALLACGPRVKSETEEGRVGLELHRGPG